MKKVLCVLVMMILAGVGSVGLSVAGAKVAYAADCEHSILGLRPWYAGLTMKGDSCALESPTEAEMPMFVWRIVLNVLSDVSMIAGYLAIGFVIYGGLQYIMSAGDPGKVAKGKKMLSSAAIGLIMAILATVIVNIIIAVLAEAAA